METLNLIIYELELWKTYHTQDNLLFTKRDLIEVQKTRFEITGLFSLAVPFIGICPE